jgi:hypothetical protein
MVAASELEEKLFERSPKGHLLCWMPGICGAWVGVLPKLAQNPQARYGHVLSLAIEALSSCVTSKSYAASIQTYTAALEAVRTGITVQNNLVNAEVIAAITCLTLAEVNIDLNIVRYSC